MRRLSEPMAALLTAIGDRPDALRHNAQETPAWWLEGGFGVRAGVARSAMNKGFVEKTTGWPDQPHAGCYSRTEAGRLALAEQEARDA